MDVPSPVKPQIPGDGNQPQPTDVEVKVEYGERISRLFIFRGLWIYIMMWPLIFWWIWIMLINFVHFWHMLILGRRSRYLWDSAVRFHRHNIKWQHYFGNLTNKRPRFVED